MASPPKLPVSRAGGLAARARDFRRSPAPHHQALRFVVNGGVVAVFNVSLGLLLVGPAGFGLQAAIPVAHVSALLLNYVLQRVFVFAHAERFAARVGTQFVRYLVVALGQYGLVVALTTALPGPLGVSDRLVYVVAALGTPVLTFVLLRTFVFHGSPEELPGGKP